MLFASLVRLLRVPLPLQRIALPKKGDEIARDECKGKEHQTFDSHVAINLLGTQNAFSKNGAGPPHGQRSGP
jgi:hypothetical protein